MKNIYILISVYLFLGIGISKAQISTIYSFSNSEFPYGSLTISGNKMFGMTDGGGANGDGYIFAINRNGAEFEDLWDFKDTGLNGNANGKYPYGNLILVNGKLYGFTYNGGANNTGVIFSIDTNGAGYKDLWDFNAANGDFPEFGQLTLMGKKFYGMTYNGGANSYGVIFSIDTNGGGYRDLFDFNDTNGKYPYCATLNIFNNKMYGMTNVGGLNGDGVVFSIDTNGKRYTDLFDFNYTTNGRNPYGSLTLSGNKLYGMTESGRSGYDDGTIFSIDTNGNGYKDMLNFNYINGEYPFGSLTISSRGKLYGMTQYGGANDAGALFSIDTGSGILTDLFSFDATHGSYPQGNNITILGDTLYGMTYEGGFNNYGLIFSYIDTNIISGTNEPITSGGNINIYPNPNNGRFTIQLANSQQLIANRQIVVYNVLGEKIYTAQLLNPAGNNQVNLSSSAGGIYIYTVITADGSVIEQGKIVLEK